MGAAQHSWTQILLQRGGEGLWLGALSCALCGEQEKFESSSAWPRKSQGIDGRCWIIVSGEMCWLSWGVLSLQGCAGSCRAGAGSCRAVPGISLHRGPTATLLLPVPALTLVLVLSPASQPCAALGREAPSGGDFRALAEGCVSEGGSVGLGQPLAPAGLWCCWGG